MLNIKMEMYEEVAVNLENSHFISCENVAIKFENTYERENASHLSDLCQTCLANSTSTDLKDMLTLHDYNGKKETYSLMLGYCFSINMGASRTPYTRMICEPCITSLREVVKFKSQVETSQRNIELWLDGNVSLPFSCIDHIKKEPSELETYPNDIKDIDVKYNEIEKSVQYDVEITDKDSCGELSENADPTFTPSISKNKNTDDKETSVAAKKRPSSRKKIYSATSLPSASTCNHNSKSYKCSLIKKSDLQKFHETFYSMTEKKYQDALILNLCKAVKIKRRRPSNKTYESKQFQTKFTFRMSDGSLIPVCQKTFLGSINISKHRVQNILKNFSSTGKLPTENRGGDHRSRHYLSKMAFVLNFIKKIKCTDAQFRGDTSSARKHLSAGPSIREMYCMCKSEAQKSDVVIKESYFRRVYKNFKMPFGGTKFNDHGAGIQNTNTGTVSQVKQE